MSLKNKIALITGINGFIGANLAHRLLENDWTVHGIVRPDSSTSYLESLTENHSNGVLKLHTYDGHITSLIAIFENASPEIVFHLASLYITEHMMEQIDPLISSNILFGTQICEAMSQTGVHYLINTGTSWQHFHNEDYQPVNLYAATKQAFFDILHYYTDAKAINATTLELYDSYGKGDPRPKLLNLIKKTLAEQNTLEMSPGEQQIDLVHIDDITNAYTLAAELLTSGQISNHTSFAISSGHVLTLKSLITEIEHVTGQKAPIKWGRRPYREREVMTTWNRGTCLPGWHTKTDLKNGLRDFFMGEN